MDNETKSVQSGITYRYIVALSLIAILSTVAFYTLLTAIQSTNSTAYIVNISGKQRMLSQHIALDVHRIDDLLSTEDKSSYGYELVKVALISHAKEMLTANEILSTGKLPNQKNIILSPAMKDIYFGDMQLASRVEKYAKTALLLVENKGNNKDELKQFIDKHSEPILIDLNKAVNQYQIEGEEQLEYIQTLETIVWILTIITLLLEVIFIFQPMAREIATLSSLNQKTLESLEATVELRTLHLENANNKLKHLASHDPLTGLRNRLELEKYIEDAIHQYNQHRAPYGIIMFDIDFFKLVNDTYGHDIGDLVLVEIAKILRTSIRENDKAFRAGGEEFVVLLNRITLEDSINVTQKIMQLVENKRFEKNGEIFTKTISCGLYHSSLFEVDSVKSVLGLVDKALYQSKANGRNQFTIVDKSLQLIK